MACMRIRIAALIVGTALALSACAGDQPLSPGGTAPTDEAPSASQPAPSEASESAVAEPSESPSPAIPATKADLDSIQRPEECGGSPDGEVLFSAVPPIFVDANHDGADEAVGVVMCDEAGSDELIVVVGHGSEILHSFALDNPSSGITGSRITALSPEGEGFKATGVDASGNTVEGTFSFDAEGTPRAEGSNQFSGTLLTMGGFGPIRIGATADELVASGWGRETTAGTCQAIEPSDTVASHGIRFSMDPDGELEHIWTEAAGVATERGAMVGKTLDELLTAYGDRLSEGDDEYPYYYSLNDQTMTFSIEDDQITRIDVFTVPFNEVAAWQDACG